MEESHSGPGNVGTVLTAVLIVFVVLKLTGEVDWSWWLVLAPLWIPLAFVFVLFLIFASVSIARS